MADSTVSGHECERAGGDDLRAGLDALTRALIDGFQDGFPLSPTPFADVGARLGVPAAAVIERLQNLLARGAIDRVGAVVRPNAVGASCLAALAVAPERLDTVAAIVNAHAEVNHNYAREHDFNLWFVVAADDETALEAVLTSIEASTGLEVLRLPLVEAYHIDLGFPIAWT